MKKKGTIITLCIVGGIATIITGIFLVYQAWMGLYYFIVSTSPEPPKPEITYGEFPFKIVYEIDGEVISVEDTLVIEHKGVDWDEAVGKYNKWNTYWMNQEDEQYVDYTKVIIFKGFTDGNSTSIKFDLGSCEYYMGLEESSTFYEDHGMKPGDIVQYSRDYNGPISEDDLYEKFGIKIIEKSISDPLTNSQS